MNKPASSEPSMDEILSSIRQIIADEDEPQGDQETNMPAAATDPVSTEADADAAMMAAEPAEVAEAIAPSEAPLELSPDQMVSEANPKADDVDSGLDIEFSPASSGMDIETPAEPAQEAVMEPEAEPEIAAEPEPAVLEEPAIEENIEESSIDLVIADDIAFDSVEDEPAFEDAALKDTTFEEPQIEEPAISPTSLPDPDLSADMADKLLAPAADAAVRSTFSKLNALAIGGAELTLEGIVRDMLRPMLKEWLDENLPATVERMVEKEIERVSRGG